jgi:NAD+ synthase (glutamine-hydrolysing)
VAQLRIALAQVDATVGDLAGNADLIVEWTRRAADRGAHLVVFPEMFLTGYPVEDLIQWQGFVTRQWTELNRFARETADLETVFVIGVSILHEGLRYNCAATVAGGRIWALTPKQKLPTYNIFYEGRTLSRGVPGILADVHGVPFGDLIVRFDFGKDVSNVSLAEAAFVGDDFPDISGVTVLQLVPFIAVGFIAPRAVASSK